jgi:N-acyl-D-amino-acid deacylase
MTYSFIIKGGTVFDGSGEQPIKTDIGIDNDSISHIGDLSGQEADQIIDASDLFVSPGFIDITNHSDTYWTLLSMPAQESMITQGVTTILIGNCGESLVPLIKMEALGALERWSLVPAVSIDWTTTKEFYSTLQKLRIGVNVGTLIGQEMLKRQTNNNTARYTLLNSALEDGAWGLSSNFSLGDWSRDISSDTLDLLKILKNRNGLYKIHLRDEGKDFLPAVSSVIHLAHESGVRTVISHLKAVGKSAWQDFEKALSMIESAKKSGIAISYDIFPYQRTGSMLISLLPEWVRREKGFEILQALSDKNKKQRLLEELKNLTLHGDRMILASALKAKSFVGKTFDEISKILALPLEEVIIEMLKLNSLNVTFFGKTIHGKNLLDVLATKNTIIASDGAGYSTSFETTGDLAHPRSFGTYPRFFSNLAQKTHINNASAIKAMTSLPATAMGLEDRGILKTGNKADIVVFDKNTFSDKSTYKQPFEYSTGVKYVFINGKTAIDNGVIMQERHGTVLRKP